MTNPSSAPLSLLTLNVGNPSRDRAERQIQWLSGRNEQILVLTETCTNEGSRLLATSLANAGWIVRFPEPVDGERGVLVASRVGAADRSGDVTAYLPARAEAITLNQGEIDVIGLYVPSRDASTVKTERKQRFIDALSDALDRRAPRPAVLLGDLNIVEPDHRPHYRFFRDWEYGLYQQLVASGWVDAYRLTNPTGTDHSWVSRDDDGYRYDHVFITEDLVPRVVSCHYEHETRELGLTDHSAMTTALAGIAAEPLETLPGLTAGPPALF